MGCEYSNNENDDHSDFDLGHRQYGLVKAARRASSKSIAMVDATGTTSDRGTSVDRDDLAGNKATGGIKQEPDPRHNVFRASQTPQRRPPDNLLPLRVAQRFGHLGFQVTRRQRVHSNIPLAQLP